ncbi:MAG: NIPSNAP family protein, partial [Marinoscillum sp.]
MSRIIAIVFVFTLVSCSSSNSETASESQFAEPQFFELRTYYCNPGKLDDLLLRFSDHTMRLFEKHGMTNVGYWVPLDNTDDKLVYL